MPHNLAHLRHKYVHNKQACVCVCVRACVCVCFTRTMDNLCALNTDLQVNQYNVSHVTFFHRNDLVIVISTRSTLIMNISLSHYPSSL